MFAVFVVASVAGGPRCGPPAPPPQSIRPRVFEPDETAVIDRSTSTRAASTAHVCG
jgi:hypothetical protein